MQLTINGESQHFHAPLSVEGLIVELGLAERRIAVELNGEILPRSQHANQGLQDGDELEIVHAIGGG